MTNVEVRYNLREHTDDLPMPEYDPSSEHPTPEQLFLREAAKHLTPKQRAVWEYHNYDRLTQDEIAKIIGITQVGVQHHIRASEARIAKWCAENQTVYNVIKESLKDV